MSVIRFAGTFFRLWGRAIFFGNSVIGLLERLTVLVLLLVVGLVVLNNPVEIFIAQESRVLIDRTIPLGQVVVSGFVVLAALIACGLAWIKAEWMTKNIEILFDPECQLCVRHELSDQGWYRSLSLGVRNKSPDTITDVVARVLELSPRDQLGNLALPADLEKLAAIHSSGSSRDLFDK